MTLPLLRRSPINIPRRDLVLSTGDDFTLRLTLVEADRPDSERLDLLGIGPRVQLVISHEPHPIGWRDYGAPCPAPLSVLWSTFATATDRLGGIDFIIPRGTAADWRGRLRWTVLVDYLDDLSVVAEGILHLRHRPGFPVQHLYLLTEDGTPILTEADFLVEL